MSPGKRTPLHTHPHADETFYLLDGSMLLHIEGVEHEVRTGGVAVIPRGVPHGVLGPPAGARMLCLHTPGGGEDFYRTASEPALPGQPAVAVDLDRDPAGRHLDRQHDNRGTTALLTCGPMVVSRRSLPPDS